MQSGNMKNISKRKMKAELKEQETQYQDIFVDQLAKILCDPKARELRCFASSGKSCACISKYIINGPCWKEKNTLELNKSLSIVDGQMMIFEPQLSRARDLIGILHNAAELKKEKCYDSNEGLDGKTVKELRGMIGLGNGRKRSKKYELFVLDNRELLRERFCLCEKAAQKILGYSINFLYKKLRTNPEKTSRLGATSKTDKVIKSGRQLMPIQELQAKAITGQDQCCSRNCIQNLVTKQLKKIENWRERLEGCGQKMAQQIVAEVLQEAESLDGPNSFCQNVVHWVTGCSFKKIRRVRDHLKKDPKSLPEHGLKRYWKGKERSAAQFASSAASSYPSGVAPRLSTPELPSFTVQASATKNQNNSSNRYTPSQMDYQLSVSPKPPPNQTLPINEFTAGFPLPMQGSSASVYQQLGTSTSQPVYVTPMQAAYNHEVPGDSGSFVAPNITLNLGQPMETNSSFQSSHIPLYHNHDREEFEGALLAQNSTTSASQPFIQAPYLQASEASQYSELQPSKQMQDTQADSQANVQMYPASFVANVDPSSTDTQQPSYYIAANPDHFQPDVYHTGMTPLILAQQLDQTEDNSTIPKQSFFLFSPPPISDSDKSAENWPQFVPLTPVQMYPSQYFQTGALTKTQGQQQTSQAQFAPPAGVEMTDSSENSNLTDQGNNPAYAQANQFPPNLTPVVMQADGSFIPGWYASQPIGQTHQAAATEGEPPGLPDTREAGNYTESKPDAKNLQQPVGFIQVGEAPQQFFQLQNFSAQTLNPQDVPGNAQELPKYAVPSDLQPAMGGLAYEQGESQEPEGSETSKPVDEEAKGAAICDRNKRFSRDRLGATIESPRVVSVVTPVAGVVADEGGKQSAVQVFNFPPAHVSRRMAALRMEGPPVTIAEQIESKAIVNSNQTSNAPGDVTKKAQGKNRAGPHSSSGSIGYIPDDLLQRNDPLIIGLSEMKSLPVLNLPSAGWSNETVTVKADLSVHQKPQESGDKTQSLGPAGVKTERQDSTQIAQEAAVKSLLPAPMKKKRKAEDSNPRGVANQKQIRFHIFTPSDFANGQVNVSQFRKPSVFASSAVGFTEGTKKRAQKTVKKQSSAGAESVAVKGETSQEGGFATKQEENSIVNKQESSLPDVALTDAAIPKVEASAQPPNTEQYATPPLKTPAVLKKLPPNVNVLVPSSDSSNAALPMPLNTPVFVHSGKLLTPSAKPTYFCRVSPGQSFDKTPQSSTPQFFNFMPGSFFFASIEPPGEAKKKLSKSSESSEESPANKSSSTLLNRSHMTLNLSSKTSTNEDSLQTPSKLLVVTPSAMLSTKLTPDMHPSFNFQELFEKRSPDEASSKNQPENANPTDKSESPIAGESPTAQLGEMRLPSIVIDETATEESSTVSTPPETDDLDARESRSSSKDRRPSEEEGKLLIALDDSPKSSGPSFPLDTPKTIQVVTPTVAGQVTSSAKTRLPSFKFKPSSLVVSSATSQVSTPTFYQLMSPGQRSASSPSVMLLSYPQKGASLSTASLLSPAFGLIPRSTSSGGGHASLRKSALTKKIPIFQFPPEVAVAEISQSVGNAADKAEAEKQVSDLEKSVDGLPVGEDQGTVS